MCVSVTFSQLLKYESVRVSEHAERNCQNANLGTGVQCDHHEFAAPCRGLRDRPPSESAQVPGAHCRYCRSEITSLSNSQRTPAHPSPRDSSRVTGYPEVCPRNKLSRTRARSRHGGTVIPPNVERDQRSLKPVSGLPTRRKSGIAALSFQGPLPCVANRDRVRNRAPLMKNLMLPCSYRHNRLDIIMARRTISN